VYERETWTAARKRGVVRTEAPDELTLIDTMTCGAAPRDILRAGLVDFSWDLSFNSS
jgi:hypothetical protein